MTVTTTNMYDWLGITTNVISSASMTECLAMAVQYCEAYSTAMGIGTGGTAYEIAVKYMCAVNVWKNLDVRGIKPNTVVSAGMTLTSDTAGACAEFEKLAQQALENHLKANAPSKRDLYMRHLRSGQKGGWR